MSSSFIILLISICLLLIGIMLYLKNRRIDNQWNIPEGPIVYADIIHPEIALNSKSWYLRGKPDYIVKTNQGDIVPVEVKTGNHDQPKPWHIMQLIAYCHLVSDHFDKSVSYGVLVYYDTKKQFRIPYSTKYQNILTSTMNKMYDHLLTNKVYRTQNDETRCVHCSFHQVCPEYNDDKRY